METGIVKGRKETVVEVVRVGLTESKVTRNSHRSYNVGPRDVCTKGEGLNKKGVEGNPSTEEETGVGSQSYSEEVSPVKTRGVEMTLR